MTERRELSTPYGHFATRIVPWIAGPVAMLFPIAVLLRADLTPTAVAGAAIQMVMGISFALLIRMRGGAYRVWMDTTHLEIRGGNKACLVALRDLRTVELEDFGRSRIMILRLVPPCRFGDTIRFTPAEEPFARERFARSSRLFAELTDIAQRHGRQ